MFIDLVKTQFFRCNSSDTELVFCHPETFILVYFGMERYSVAALIEYRTLWSRYVGDCPIVSVTF